MYLVFDIGGSKTRLGISEDKQTLLGEPRIIDTPRVFEDGMKLIGETVGEMLAGKKLTAAAGGVAGVLDKTKSELARAPHLDGWAWKPLGEGLETALNCPIRLENDSAVVGLGEAHEGKGKGQKVVAYLTVSTGVGGARIIDGKINESSFGFEPGHQIIVPDGAMCLACGVKGHLEAYISGYQVGITYKMPAYEIADANVWEELSKYLAIGVNNILVHWSPDIVVIGGSMMKQVGIPIERVRHHLKDIFKIFPAIPPVELAALGDLGGLYGGLALHRENPDL
jgi:glucokinase